MAAAAIPAIGAIAGGFMAKKQGMNPLLGAVMGGMGGYALGPAMGAMGGAASGGSAGAMASAVPGLSAGGQQAAMLAAQNAGFGMGGLHATGLAGGGQGLGLLGNAMANPQLAAKALGSMQNMAQPQQPQIMPPPPPPMAAQQRPGSMASLGIGQSMYQPRRTTFG